MNALYRIAEILTRQSGYQKMLHDVLDILDDQLGMDRGTIMLLSLDRSEVVVEAAKNIDSRHREDLKYQKGEGVIGRVLMSGKPVIVPRISQEPEFRDRIHQRGPRICEGHAFICVPISLDAEVVGTLSVDVPHNQADYLIEQQRFLSIVASLIAYDLRSRRNVKKEKLALEAENLQLRSALSEKFRPENIIGNSNAMREVYLKIHQVAASDITVLVRGESGTGKELVASAVHYNSPRSRKTLVKVNCAALSESLIESELFGHEKGAYTGAFRTRIGRFEEADNGTIFLDEIGEFSPMTQIKLLRVLQEKEIQRVGGNQTIKVNVRVIAATNKDLEAAVEAGTFRRDLYYRINVFALHLPPLCDRKDDILQLADYFVGKYAIAMGKKILRISTTAINMMTAYHWPGNVRELENCIEHAVLLSHNGVIQGHHLPPTLQMPESVKKESAFAYKAQISQLERDLIMDALKRTKGNVNTAARELGISSRSLRYKIQSLNIDYQRLFKSRSKNN